MTTEAMTERKRWIALYVLCAGVLMIVIDATIVNVALPSIQDDLGFSQSNLAWVVNAYLIAFGGLLLLAGRIGDLIGQRRVFLVGLAVFTAASLLCAVAQSQGLLIGARFVQGVGGALTSAVILGMIAEKAGPARVQTPWERADIALEVRLPDNLVLRGRNLRVSGSGFGIGDMNVITGGSFDVTKRPNASVDVRGTLEIVSGSYSFQGRRFDIERGSDVRFPGGGSLTDPLVNLNATREVSGVTAEVRVRGSARSPELTLSSRPPLDESDILSLIVFNQPVSSLGSAEQVNLGERAAAMAAGAITSPLADSIGRALNLDVFEIQAPTSENGTGAVVIGSQLGSRVLVGLKQQFGHSETSMVTLEYRVNRLLRFITSVASGTLQAHATRRADRGGVDLIFVIRY